MSKESEGNNGSSRKMDGLPDLGQLRLRQDFGAQVGVKKRIITVPVRKPSRQEFVQVRPGDDYRLETLVLEMKEDRETYLIAPELRDELMGEAVPKILFTAINRQGVLFLWSVRLPDADGKLDTWNSSALGAAKAAEDRWVRVAANKSLGAYDVFEAIGAHADPVWPPDLTFPQILNIAFKERYIDRPDHILLRKLRGEV